jgi:hypothetical protein
MLNTANHLTKPNYFLKEIRDAVDYASIEDCENIKNDDDDDDDDNEIFANVRPKMMMSKTVINRFLKNSINLKPLPPSALMQQQEQPYAVRPPSSNGISKKCVIYLFNCHFENCIPVTIQLLLTY